MNGSERTIVTQGLVKRFGDFTAVHDVSFHVNAGEIFGFLGPNGSGKTTTIRMMLGLLPASEGSVHVLDIPVLETPAVIRSQVGYMSQHFSLYNDLSVVQNLRFYGTAYGLSGGVLMERMEEAIHLAGLSGRETVRSETLSGGWRQRLALGAAILHQPRVLFLDEPTAGVDPVSRREFWELLYGLVERGVTVFVTTHYMDEAEHCHRLAFIQNGELIATGSPDELKVRMMAGKVLEIEAVDVPTTVGTLRRAASERPDLIGDVEVYGSLVHVALKNAETHSETIKDMLGEADLLPESIREIEPSLEDVFIACMRQGNCAG
jgi:ABC-2 type transport system ATP-binding protein